MRRADPLPWIAMAMLVGVIAGCGTERGTAAAPTPAATAAVTPSPTPAAISAAVLGPFAFDAPATWTITRAGHPQHYRTVQGFVATPGASARETCGPEYIPGLGGCDEQIGVPDGGVVVAFTSRVQPPCLADARATVASDVAAGWRPMTIDGLPAAYDAVPVDPSGFTRTWEIAGPQPGDCSVYEVRAQFGAAAEERVPVVDAIVASLTIEVPSGS